MIADATTEPTRRRLITAAERLFAARGIDGVSLREITKDAGARNSVAIQYHFGDRNGLLAAILKKHDPTVEAGRHAILDRYEAAQQSDVRELARALVLPLAAKLADPDGGCEFLQIYADLVNRPRPIMRPGSMDDPALSIGRWRQLVQPLLSPEAILLHRRYGAILYVVTETARRAQSGAREHHALFANSLVDVTAAMLIAPVSDETKRLIGLPPAARTRHGSGVALA
jgi:AcrR family transcriptional regulator